MGFRSRHWGHDSRREFYQSYRYVRVVRPAALLFNIFVFYLLLRWLGSNVFTLLFAVFITVKEFIHLYFMWRLEKRIFKPLEALKNGVEAISQGNYHVRVETVIPNEIGVLTHSFNEMAKRLQEGEITKARYEENRKALLVNISHDLKTPISSIQGLVEMIRDGQISSPDKVQRYLQIIDSNVHYINRLVDDLFLFSKLDMEKLEFSFEEINIREYVRDVADELAFELGEKGISISYVENITTSNSAVRLDRKRLYQVIRNIVDNAVKYGNKPDLAIIIELTQQENQVCIAIRDNGPGIPEELLPEIFNRFYRIERQRPKDLNSTGLGLAIAKELVEAHNGSISVTSSQHGSCFAVVLPLLRDEVKYNEESSSH